MRPRGGGIDPPGQQGRDQDSDGSEILAVIRPEIQPRPLPHPAGDEFKKGGLQEAVLMMTFFGPRVGKQHPEFGKRDVRWQRIDQFASFGLDEVAVSELGALGLAVGSPDAVADQVHAQAKTLRMLRRVAREEMPVPAANLQRDGGCGRDKRGQLGAQRGAALGDMLDEFWFGSHAPYRREEALRRNPEAVERKRDQCLARFSAAMSTIRMLISTGFTPLMRPAWPRFTGRCCCSLSALSRRRPGILA